MCRCEKGGGCKSSVILSLESSRCIRCACPDDRAFEHARSMVTWHEAHPECDNHSFASSSVQPFVDTICGSVHTHVNKHTDSEEDAWT